MGRATRLPGFADGVTRTFDAPETLDSQFHEIHAKSALNRVPGASKLPFGGTVNPYRGCTHSCVYCAGGETPILMGDGQRPYLTANNSLLGTGGFASPPLADADYRQGYLCGMVRGANLATYHYSRDGHGGGTVHRFRLALTDFEESSSAGRETRARAG